jgi:L-amino acid N-acyltransferase YncA
MSNTALYHESLSLTEALMNYPYQPIYRRLRKLGKRESKLHPDVRQRRGVGKRRLQEAIAHGPQLGIHSLVGLIFGHNQPRIALFRAAGFKRWGLLPRRRPR